jgi:CHAT domain-containing protein
LIIDATTSGYVDDLKLYLGKLKNVSEECDWVLDWLNKNRSKSNIGDVRLLRAKAGEAPLAQQVKEALESREWGLVHFAGHSYANNGAEYIFFPGAMEGSLDRVDLNRFSDWLRRATLTYFSSCDSGAGPFVFALANRRVSNILAFRWEIDDALAFEYAKEFYQNLFNVRSIEQAFFKARKKMHELHPDDRIWAAPILIKQLADS